jgi:hypothetical protein
VVRDVPRCRTPTRGARVARASVLDRPCLRAEKPYLAVSPIRQVHEGCRTAAIVPPAIITAGVSPLLAIGLVLGAVLYLYFFVEDVFAGLPTTRAFLRDLYSREAKLEKLATPQFARLAAVIES